MRKFVTKFLIFCFSFLVILAVISPTQEENSDSKKVPIEAAAEVVFSTPTVKPAEPVEVTIESAAEVVFSTPTAKPAEVAIEAAAEVVFSTPTVGAEPVEDELLETTEVSIVEAGEAAPPPVPADESPRLEPEEAESTEVTIEAAAEVDFSTQPAEAATEAAPVEEEPVLLPLVTVSNDFIHLEVNPGPSEAGRFSIETVRGDPTVDTDDKKILIYGRPRPWTSFTTIKVDGKNYVFGGPTRRRAGRGAEYGEMVEPPRVEEGGALVTKCRIAGLDVTQRLEIAGGPVSGMLDTIRASYTVSNPTDEARRVSLRILLDTLLGSNDGAPFRAGERDITSEARMSGGEVMDFWVAFDSLEEPGVVARGTLRGEGLTVPDEVVFANWGKLADKVFEVPFEEGKSFQREGEEEMDSATALYWNDREVLPGGELRFVTMYGIDYLHVVGDVLSVGSVPFLGEWQTGKNQIRPHVLYVYVGNLAEFDLTDVVVELGVSDGVVFSEGEAVQRRFQLLKPGEEYAVGWRVEPKPFSDGEREIAIRAKSAEVEGVEMKARVTLLSPPGVDARIEAPDALTLIGGKRYGPANPFQIKLVCRNEGESPIDNLGVKLSLPDGLIFPAIIDPAQAFPRLDGKGTIVFTWKVIATGEASGALPYRVMITSDSTESKSITRTIQVPPMPTKVEWTGVPKTAGQKVIFPAEIFINFVRGLKKAEFSVEFDPEVLTVIRVSQGTAFVEEGLAMPWREPKIDNRGGRVSGIVGGRGDRPFSGSGSLAVIHFATRGQGVSEIKVTGLRLASPEGGIEALVENTSIEVK